MALVAFVRLLHVLVKEEVVVEVSGALEGGSADVADGLGVRVSPSVRVEGLLVLEPLPAEVANEELPGFRPIRSGPFTFSALIVTGFASKVKFG